MGGRGGGNGRHPFPVVAYWHFIISWIHNGMFQFHLHVVVVVVAAAAAAGLWKLFHFGCCCCCCCCLFVLASVASHFSSVFPSCSLLLLLAFLHFFSQYLLLLLLLLFHFFGQKMNLFICYLFIDWFVGCLALLPWWLLLLLLLLLQRAFQFCICNNRSIIQKIMNKWITSRDIVVVVVAAVVFWYWNSLKLLNYLAQLQQQFTATATDVAGRC